MFPLFAHILWGHFLKLRLRDVARTKGTKHVVFSVFDVFRRTGEICIHGASKIILHVLRLLRTPSE
jgi:hypothetical protein